MAEDEFGTHTGTSTSGNSNKWNTLLDWSLSSYTRTGGTQTGRCQRISHSKTVLHSTDSTHQRHYNRTGGVLAHFGQFDSAREIEIYLRRTIIPDISWNSPWNGISSITAKRAWVGRVGSRSFDYQPRCRRCSLPCPNVQMKSGELMYTSKCGCTDEAATPTDKVQNMREPGGFSWVLESWEQINHEEWKATDEKVSNHHKLDHVLTDEQRVRCGLWRWGQRLHTRIPIIGEPQSHWMVVQTLPATPLFRNGSERRLVAANTRQMLNIPLTRTARRVEFESTTPPQTEGFRGEDRVLECARQTSNRAGHRPKQGVTQSRRRQGLNCFWWRSWHQGMRERRIEGPIRGWQRDDEGYKEDGGHLSGKEPQEVCSDEMQVSMVRGNLRPTGHKFCGTQAPVDETDTSLHRN